jgi:uncharacterized membrane protein YebE (DUF533 family)
MFNMTRQRVVVALTLMVLLFLGTAAAQATDTKGADRTVKGAVAGAAVGTITQMIRGRDQGKELLKGAAVGAAAGAAVGAYSDYRQERNAREDDRRYYRDGRYREGRYYRDARPAYRYDRGRQHRRHR